VKRAKGAPTLVSSKLSPPAPIDALIRPDVLTRIGAGAKKRLLVVRAPAGYGKTTVVRAAAQRLGWTMAWYRMDVLDHDPMAMIGGLVASIRHASSGFGEVLLQRLSESRDASLTVSQALALLVSELEDTTDRGLKIVLDDYHEAAASAELNEALDYLLASLPVHVAMILLTRYQPAISTARLRLDDQVAEIDYEDLRLDLEQTAHLLSGDGATTIDRDQIGRLLELTEGWPAGIVLAAKAGALVDLGHVERALADPRLKNDLFSYLAEETLGRESQATARFLMRTACLDSMTVELANEVAGCDDAHRRLRRLVANQVFTFADPDATTYRYHHLFREFLCHKYVQENGAAALRELQLRAARAVERAGDPEMAIELHFAANDPEGALAVIVRAGELVTDSCRIDALRSWVERLSGSSRALDPRGLYLRGHLALRTGQWDESIRLLEEAHRALDGASDRATTYQVLSALEAAYFWKSDLERARDCCRLALAVATTPRERVHTLISLGSAHNHLGEWKEMDCAWTEAERLARGCDMSELTRVRVLRAWAHYNRGFPAEALVAMRKCLDEGRRYVKGGLAAGVAGSQAEMLAELSEYTMADRYFDEAEAICTRNGYGHMDNMVTAGSGFLEACASDAESGRDTINALLLGDDIQHDSEIHAMTLVDMALVCRLTGRQADAFDYCSQGLAVARRHALLRPVLHLGTLSEYLHCRSDAAHSTGGLGAIATRAESTGYLDIPHKCRFYAAVVSYARDQWPAALDEMAEEAEELLRLGFRRFMAIELATEPDLALPLAARLTDTQAAFLMAALARTPAASPILLRFVDADPRLAEIAAETAATEFDDKLWARFARTARRSGSPRLRRTAARLSADRDPARRAAGQAEGLTRRETEVLSLIAEGQRNAEIAATLFLSEKTVKTHVNHVFTKLEVRDRVQAVLYYREHLDRE